MSSSNRGHYDYYNSPIIVILGMDSPEKPIHDIAHALTIPLEKLLTHTHTTAVEEGHNSTRLKSVNKSEKSISQSST
jgi:hypothetical protein